MQLRNFKIFYLYLTLAVTILVSLTTSCRKVPINGKLDGQWQVMKVEYDDGTTVTPSSSYYCFSLHVAQLNGNGGGSANMVYDGDVITLDFPYIKSENAAKSLYNFGIAENPASLTVVKLTGSTLVMQSSVATVTCRRF